MKYEIEPFGINFYLVKKLGKKNIFYPVELNFYTNGKHACGCDWFAQNNWKGPRSHCKHIKLVEAYRAKDHPKI